MMEQSPSDLSKKVVSFDKLDEEKKKNEEFDIAKYTLKALNAILEHFGEVTDEMIVKVTPGALPVSACFHVNSNGIGAAVKLAI